MTGVRAQKNPPWVLQLLRASAQSDISGVPAKKLRRLRVSGAMLAFSGVTSVLLVNWLGAADIADIIALRIAAYACWLIGGIGLWTLLSPQALTEETQQLASLRGARLSPSLFAAVGAFRQLGKAMLWASLPGLIAALLVSTHVFMFSQRIALILVVIAYLLSLAAVLALVALVSIRVSERRARWTAGLIVLLPFLLSLASALPLSIPGLYIWVFEKLIAWGGFVA